MELFCFVAILVNLVFIFRYILMSGKLLNIGLYVIRINAFLLFFSNIASAQITLDSIWGRVLRIEEKQRADSADLKDYKDLTFYYMNMAPLDTSENSKGFKLSGYVDTYYALYSDEVGLGNYQKFPTVAPRNNSFGLNMLMLSGKYKSNKLRSTFTLHYGDIPDAAWSTLYNNIQEANIGFRLGKKWWFDMGYFRTHLGFESIQPRENMTTSVATTTYFEPYYLSGAKLSYALSSKITLVANVFNGFNSFVAVNNSKTVGLSINYEPSERVFFTYNNLLGTNDIQQNKFRTYHNIYYAFKGKRWDVGAELNFGSQAHTKLADTTKTAYMVSGLVSVRYKIKKGKYGLYMRGEVFEDSDEILTGPVQNKNHQLVGVNLVGVTIGGQVKPLPNSYLRLEYRGLLCTKQETIFYTNKDYTNVRQEIVSAFGIWF